MDRTSNKRKNTVRTSQNGKKAKNKPNGSKRTKNEEESVGFEAALDDSDVDETPSGSAANGAPAREHSLFDDETPDEKRRRKAMQFLKQTQDRENEDEDAAGSDSEEEISSSQYYKNKKQQASRADQISARLCAPGSDTSIACRMINRAHQLPVTAVALSPDDRFVYSASKDGSIRKWDVETGQKIFDLGGKRTFLPGTKASNNNSNNNNNNNGEWTGHSDHVLSLAVSHDGRFLASVGKDKLLKLWDTQSNTLVDDFKGHRDIISAVCFRKASNPNELFTGSHDRTVKVWNADEGAYIETLYGHRSDITCVDSLSRERCVSSSSDKTICLWKVPEETRLEFKGGHTASVDCVQMITEDHFLSGAQDGSLALWSTQKKKPTALLRVAHGWDYSILQHNQNNNNSTNITNGNFSSNGSSGSYPVSIPNRNGLHRVAIQLPGNDTSNKNFTNSNNNNASEVPPVPCWISSLATIKYSDVAASGSNNGAIHLWKTQTQVTSPKIAHLFSIPVVGFVNSLEFGHRSGSQLLVAGIGQEHKWGRWQRIPQARNSVAIFSLPQQQQ